MRVNLALCIPLLLSLTPSTQAQSIIRDGSTNTQVLQNNVIVPIGSGTVSGNNLYHSFSQFDVPTSGATFGLGSSVVNGRSINNIFSRVTGDVPSSIMGLIQSRQAFPNANLYLMNPNGIVFGENARLDIGGSFYATTATSIAFSSGEFLNSRFDASFPNGSPTNVQFAVEQPAAIISQGNLSVPAGKNITLIGGSVISLGRLEAPNGAVDIAAAPGNSTVILRSPNFVIGLEIRLGVLAREWQGKITELPNLAKMLTGSSGIPEANKVVVNLDGSLQLVAASEGGELSTVLLPTGQFTSRGNLEVKNGDVFLEAIATGEVQVRASRNLALLTPDIQTTRDIFLRADNLLTVRDNVSTPAIIKTAGNLVFWGNNGVDILALNHNTQPIESSGVITFRSNGQILGDSFFRSAVGISARTLSGLSGNFLSALNFSAQPQGDIQFSDANNTPASIQKNISAYRNIDVVITVDNRATDIIKPNVEPSDQPKSITPNDSSNVLNKNNGNTSTATGTSTSSDPNSSSSSSGTSTTNGSASTDPNQTSETKGSHSNGSSENGTTGSVSESAGQVASGSLTGSLSSSDYATSPVSKVLSGTADLLIQKGQILEAQKALDRSILSELENYLGTVAKPEVTLAALAKLSPSQQQLYAEYTQLQEEPANLERELVKLYQIPQENLTEADKQQVIELKERQAQASKKFQQFLERTDVNDVLTEFSNAHLKKLQAELKQMGQGAVLLYPLVRDDRLELILITPNAQPISKTVKVSRAELNQEIAAFRYALEAIYDPAVDPKVSGQKLYNWLIAPLKEELDQAKAETILYAPYAQLRYIPLAALYDGEQWLTQSYRINNITTVSLQDFSISPKVHRSVLAGAATQGISFKEGDRSITLAGLPFARGEVENITTTFADSKPMLDQDFSPASTISQLHNYNFIHMATHAEFRSGKPQDSFILFGNGERRNLADMRTWSLKGIDLVVLSACETAKGAVLGNGEEILGFGYLMQERGARAAIASLWAVDDGGTQALMEVFYTLLNQPHMTKVEALRQAQIALITGNFDILGDKSEQVKQNIQARIPITVREYLNHPNYWASFIMIGNGL